MRMIRTSAAAAVLLALCGSAGAVSLQQAYQAALKNDPTFRMNFYEKEYGKENEVIGRSYILPSVSASFSAARNIADQTSPGLFGGISTTHPRYVSRSSVVQMRQPLLNLEGVARYRQGKVQTALSDTQFQVSTNEVALRVVSRTSWRWRGCSATCTPSSRRSTSACSRRAKAPRPTCSKPRRAWMWPRRCCWKRRTT